MIEFNDSQAAFEQAIAEGRLSNNQHSPVYAGRFMYMGTKDGLDLFKNIESRRYLPASR